jgi:Fe-S oxidoreductase/nitrate reductase gamma subunit
MSMLAVVETRRIFGGETETAKLVFYVLALVTIVLFFWGLVRRVRAWSKGRRPAGWRWLRPRDPHDIPEVSERPSMASSVAVIAANKTVTKTKPSVGVAHLLVFWGFIGLFLATSILSLDYDILGNLSRLFFGHTVSFFQGPFYLGYNAVFDAAGLAAVVGTILLALRRWFSPEIQLDLTRAEQPDGGYSRTKIALGDQLFIVGLLLILLTGIVIQGLRIDGEGFPSFERWTWLGWLVAKGFAGAGVNAVAARHLHAWLWWIHVGLALAFIAYIPFSKALHMLSAPANLIVRDPKAVRQLPSPPSGKVGYTDLADFTPAELLSLDACTKCGRCHGVCPARTAGAPLSPRDLVLDLRSFLDRQQGIELLLDSEERPSPTGPRAEGGPIPGNVIAQRVLWSCTTCMACVEVCPVGIEHVPLIVQLRRPLVDAGDMDPTLQSALQNIAQQGNSFGKSARMRARWTKGLETPIVDARKEPVEYLWFVGDYASFDERVAELSRTFARILQEAGVSFGILYEDERNAGNDVRRVGEEGLFEMLVESNLAALAKAQFDAIVTTDPHSLNTLRNEYPAFGLDKPVFHYSELLAKLIYQGKVQPRQLGLRVTYHDPCYLGRYNRIFDAPRAVIGGLGCELVEMPRSRQGSFCCGAGGGRIWMDDSFLAERPSVNRIKEALSLGVDVFVVACPKDYAMFSDAVKTVGAEDRLRVMDITELFAEAVLAAPALEGASEEG